MSIKSKSEQEERSNKTKRSKRNEHYNKYINGLIILFNLMSSFHNSSGMSSPRTKPKITEE